MVGAVSLPRLLHAVLGGMVHRGVRQVGDRSIMLQGRLGSLMGLDRRDVAICSVGLVYNLNIARNFALDAFVGSSLHSAVLVLLLSAFLHIDD